MASISGARGGVAIRALRRPPILDSYILREFAGPFLFSLGAYFLFWFVNILVLAADYIINAHAPFFLVLRFLVFRMPQATPLAFPFAALFATLLAFGRLAGDNELSALRTSGVSLLRICRTPLILGIVIFLVAYTTNESISPRAIDISTRTFYQIVYHTAALPIEPQIFRKDPDTNTVFYVSDVTPGTNIMRGVMIFRAPKVSYFREVITAKQAHVEGSTLVLENAVLGRYNAEGAATSQNTAKRFEIGLPLGETVSQFLSSVNSDTFTMSTRTLAQQVHSLQMQGVGGSALGTMKMNLANKLAQPFASFIGVIIALPLAIRFGKRGRTLGIALSIITFFIYYVLSAAATAFGRNGAIDPYVAAWIPNAILGLTGMTLLFLEER